MQESGKNLWQLKKSYEIAYAAFRIAAKMGEQEFAGYLKSAAISLLGAAAGDDNAGVKKKLATLEYLIRFGMDVNIMGIANGELMLREIAGLDVAMAEVVVFAGKDPADNGVGKAKMTRPTLPEYFPRWTRLKVSGSARNRSPAKISLLIFRQKKIPETVANQAIITNPATEKQMAY